MRKAYHLNPVRCNNNHIKVKVLPKHLVSAIFICMLSEFATFSDGQLNTLNTCDCCLPSAVTNLNRSNLTDGIEEPALSLTISYIIRCVLTNDEVILVSDVNPSSLLDNVQEYGATCANNELSLLSFLSLKTFLQSEQDFFQYFLTVSSLEIRSRSKSLHWNSRMNFIFVSGSEPKMLSLIYKVEQELQLLRSGVGVVWEPVVIFLWAEIQLAVGTHARIKARSSAKQLLDSWFHKYNPQFPLDCGVFFLFTTLVNTSSALGTNHILFSLWETYNLKGSLIFRDFNLESNPSGKDKQCRDNKYVLLERLSKRSNFQRYPLVAQVADADTYADWITLEKNKNGTGTKLVRGFGVSIYRDLQYMMNFSESVVQSGDVIFNASVVKHSQLNRGVSDLVLNQVAIYPGRAEVFTFLQPTYFGTYRAFFQQPSVNSIRNIVSAPFTLPLWVTLIATWCLIFGCVHGWRYFAGASRIPLYHEDIQFISDIGLWSIATTCQRSWYTSPKTIVFKSIFYIGSLMALVCYSAYSATIVSFLSVKVVPVQKFNDLLEYKFKFTVHEASVTTILLVQEMIETFKLPQTIVTTNTEHEITHLFDANNAFISYPDLFYQTALEQNFTENFLCSNVFSMQAQNAPYKSAMFVKKGSEYREFFNEKLIMIMERGLNFRYKNTYDSKKEITCVKQQYDDGSIVVDPVHLTHVFTTFIIIFTGWVLAALILCSERVYHRRRFYYLILLY